jgi:hypothetical protein
MWKRVVVVFFLYINLKQLKNKLNTRVSSSDVPDET